MNFYRTAWLSLIVALSASPSLRAEGCSIWTRGLDVPNEVSTSSSDDFEANLRGHIDSAHTLPRQLLSRAIPRILEAQDPFSTGHHLIDDPQAEWERARKLVLFQQLVDAQAQSPSAKAHAVSEWVKNEQQALYLYQKLEDFADSEREVILDYLLLHNRYFSDSRRSRGTRRSLVTYAYDKETRSRSLSLLYKNPAYTDDEWLRRPENQREAESTPKEKTPTPANKIAPTQFKPRSAGGLQYETGGGRMREFAHQSFEISPHRLIKEMREISSILGESEGWHVKMVTDFPLSYDALPKLMQWNKQVNDYLLLNGIAEGSFPSVWSSALFTPKSNDYYFLVPADRVRNDRSWERAGKKGPTASLRPDFSNTSPKRLGATEHDSLVRVEYEVRDATRDMNTWDRYIARIGDSFGNRIWENQPDLPHAELFAAPPSLPTGLSPAAEKLLRDAEPLALLPFVDFEKGQYRDYRTGRARVSNTFAIQRIAAAREAYRKALELRVMEWKRDAASKGFTKEDLQMAIRDDLREWARASQVAELYGGF